MSTRLYLSNFLLMMIIFPIIGLAALFVNCKSNSLIEDQIPSVLISAEAMLNKTRDVMSVKDSFEFLFTSVDGSISLPGGLILKRAEGLVSGSDMLQLDVEAELGRIFVRIKLIAIGKRIWMTNPLTGDWADITETDSPFSFIDPSTLISNVLDNILNPEYLNDPLTDEHIKLTGTTPPEVFAPLVGNVVGKESLTVNITIDRQNFNLIEVQIVGKLQIDDSDRSVRIIKLSRIGENILIEAPN